MSQFFPAMSRKIFISPRKFLVSPDSQQNLQIPGRIFLFAQTALLRVVTPREWLRPKINSFLYGTYGSCM